MGKTLETKFKVKNVILVEFNVSVDICDLPPSMDPLLVLFAP